MKEIENLLQEYKIRFRDTDRIKRGGHGSPLNTPVDSLNKRTFYPYVGKGLIFNRNGIVFRNDKWAIADLKEKPTEWVIEKDESHPMWEKFKGVNKFDIPEALEFKFIAYHAENMRCYGRNNILDFKGHQFLTLDQWAELFLPKVDFSILNDEDWFYVEYNEGCRDKWLLKGVLFDKNSKIKSLASYSCETNELYGDDWHTISFTGYKEDIILFRKATPEDLAPMLEKYPELAPPKAEDWVAVWDDKAIESLFICKYKNVKNDPHWDNILKIDIADNVDKQIDNFLRRKKI